MAKPTFAKMGLHVNSNVINVAIGAQTVEIKEYLPIEDKIDVITTILETCYDSNIYPNWIKVSVIMDLEIIYAYTNIAFTDKQKEDVYKTYDLLKSSGVLKELIEAIPSEEYNFIQEHVIDLMEGMYHQKTSVLGILEAVSKDYSNLNFDASEIQKKLSDPENLELLKGIMTKLG